MVLYDFTPFKYPFRNGAPSTLFQYKLFQYIVSVVLSPLSVLFRGQTRDNMYKRRYVSKDRKE